MNRASVLALVLLSFPLYAGDVRLTGAGATFPAPLYSRWFSEHHRLHPAEKFNYQAIGSGGGIQQVINGTLDFGATDTPMTESQLERAPDTVHV
ncbi:MAG: substrate-binding domain-containing protein, partial [Myxococcaceae bacterium]